MKRQIVHFSQLWLEINQLGTFRWVEQKKTKKSTQKNPSLRTRGGCKWCRWPNAGHLGMARQWSSFTLVELHYYFLLLSLNQPHFQSQTFFLCFRSQSTHSPESLTMGCTNVKITSLWYQKQSINTECFFKPGEKCEWWQMRCLLAPSRDLQMAHGL